MFRGDAQLKEALERQLKAEIDGLDCPDGLRQGMAYSLLSGGKRIRPVLLLAVSDYYGGDRAQAMKLAVALECMHAASLIHDDLPCIDNDSLRRGKPSNHIVFGEDIAVVNGDALLNFAYTVLLSGDFTGGYLSACRLLTACGGAQGMLGGQYLDITAENNPSSDIALEEIHLLKTAKLFEAAIVSGALCGGAKESDVEALRQYARFVGFAFQIADDLLDATGDDVTIGKTARKDAAQNKRTAVSEYGIDRARQTCESCLSQGADALNCLSDQPEFLREFLTYLKDRTY